MVTEFRDYKGNVKYWSLRKACWKGWQLSSWHQRPFNCVSDFGGGVCLDVGVLPALFFKCCTAYSWRADDNQSPAKWCWWRRVWPRKRQWRTTVVEDVETLSVLLTDRIACECQLLWKENLLFTFQIGQTCSHLWVLVMFDAVEI